MQKGDIVVAPLILMTIDDLENLQFSIADFSFRELLRDYSRAHPERDLSLHNYIASSHYNDYIYANRDTVGRGAEILERSYRTLFPDARPLQQDRTG